MKRQIYIWYISTHIYVKVCIHISDMHVGWGLLYGWRHVRLAYLLSDQMSQLLLVLSLPACGFNWVRSRFGPREAVAKHTHTHTKNKVTKTMADSLFWAPDRTRPGTQKQSQWQTRDPAIPAPGSAAAEAEASSAVGAMGQELEQAIYSYAATWLTKSTCGCRSQYPNKGSNNSVVGYTVRILNSISLPNYT